MQLFERHADKTPVFAITESYFDESEGPWYTKLYVGLGHELLESALIAKVTEWFKEYDIPEGETRVGYWFRNGYPADNPVHMWVKANWA